MSANLEVKLGATVVLDLIGHGANNGAVIPEGATLGLSSNDPTVATVPATVDVPVGGTQEIDGVAVTILGPGSTDIVFDGKTLDGTPYHDSGTLVVTPVLPGLVSIELRLREVAP